MASVPCMLLFLHFNLFHLNCTVGLEKKYESGYQELNKKYNILYFLFFDCVPAHCVICLTCMEHISHSLRNTTAKDTLLGAQHGKDSNSEPISYKAPKSDFPPMPCFIPYFEIILL